MQLLLEVLLRLRIVRLLLKLMGEIGHLLHGLLLLLRDILEKLSTACVSESIAWSILPCDRPAMRIGDGASVVGRGTEVGLDAFELVLGQRVAGQQMMLSILQFLKGRIDVLQNRRGIGGGMFEESLEILPGQPDAVGVGDAGGRGLELHQRLLGIGDGGVALHGGLGGLLSWRCAWMPSISKFGKSQAVITATSVTAIAALARRG